MLVVGLRHERERPPGREAFRLHLVQAKADARDRDDMDPRVVLAHELLRRGIAQPITGPGPLEPQAQPLAQYSSSFRTAFATRCTDGMYASSICQYGYGTS